jgi:hypothetical protein
MIHHSAANSLAVRRPGKFSDDTAAGHDADAVRQTQDFIEVFADQNDGRPAIARR